MPRNKKLIVVISAIMVFALALAGCGQSSNEQAGVEKDTLVVAQSADAKSLDPHATNDSTSSNVAKQIYNTLVESTEDMEIVPGLAKEWEQVDDLTWEFKLRQGVKFHNGEELKASDVKFTFERMLQSSKVSHIVEAIDTVEVVDDYTVRIKTKEPFGPLLAHLAHSASSILNEKAVKEAGDNYGQNPVGTGPFKFKSWQAGDNIVLERFDDYFRGPSQIKQITYRVIPEGTNRTIALETGEVDIAYGIEPIDQDRVANHEDLELLKQPALAMYYVGFNVEKEPFDNKLVRKAISHAINTDDIIEAVLNGAGVKAVSPIAPRVFGYNDQLEGYEYNPEKAKELLKEAGYENGFETKIMISGSQANQIAQVVQAQLKEVGIDVAIEQIEWGTYIDKTASGDHEMFFLGWGTVTADADYGLYPMFHSASKGAAGNRFFYENKELDELLEKGKTSTDPKEREEAYKKAQEIIVDDAPLVPTHYKIETVGIQKNVKGFKIHPAGHHSLYNVHFE
ncbi:glutathione ABC transporter substrate-binding protein [Caldisalinibacter kiritimatiensis]|uniref:Extracellular solute-binding protein, family 5 n=1 Tax=Caldisalinibacter kiritimatiensis TaxID=1304284 RepID=R1CFC8_9FIRM|nr:glutathione ABC transporter substrate-binding protein [Caldisalinibacter kiritimatiensis]EOD00980.1 extracellular solute-binding protein, family 5 [Caldisalinibacter kiritimatiensis]